MEQSLVQQQRELVELKKMHADALQSRDDGKQRLQQVSACELTRYSHVMTASSACSR